MKYTIKSRIWIELDDKMLLGEGRVQLLKLIEETGSLSQAAKAVKMSYKKAWALIDSVNKTAKEPVVITSIGGKKGGGSKLTAHGKALVNAFDTINANCWNYMDQQVDTIINE